MGRTSPTTRDQLDALEREWRPFRRSLRRHHQPAFDRLFEHARSHADAAGQQNPSDRWRAFAFSVLLAQEREIVARQEEIAERDERIAEQDELVTEQAERIAEQRDAIEALRERVDALEADAATARGDAPGDPAVPSDPAAPDGSERA